MNRRRVARFKAALSNGAVAYWTADVVKIVDGIAYVRHPERARRFPFSPVVAPGLYKYEAATLTIQEVTK